MAGQYGPPPSPVQPVKQRLASSGEFDVTEHEGVVTATRRRPWTPQSGFFRVFLPWVYVRVQARGAAIKWKIRPDAIAWCMLVVMLGGLLVEWTMDRARYPREYPASFVYGLASVYLGLFVVEVVRTRRAVQRALAAAPPGR